MRRWLLSFLICRPSFLRSIVIIVEPEAARRPHGRTGAIFPKLSSAGIDES
jgi:hypothetical protein